MPRLGLKTLVLPVTLLSAAGIFLSCQLNRTASDVSADAAVYDSQNAESPARKALHKEMAAFLSDADVARMQQQLKASSANERLEAAKAIRLAGRRHAAQALHAALQNESDPLVVAELRQGLQVLTAPTPTPTPAPAPTPAPTPVAPAVASAASSPASAMPGPPVPPRIIAAVSPVKRAVSSPQSAPQPVPEIKPLAQPMPAEASMEPVRSSGPMRVASLDVDVAPPRLQTAPARPAPVSAPARPAAANPPRPNAVIPPLRQETADSRQGMPRAASPGAAVRDAGIELKILTAALEPKEASPGEIVKLRMAYEVEGLEPGRVAELLDERTITYQGRTSTAMRLKMPRTNGRWAYQGTVQLPADLAAGEYTIACRLSIEGQGREVRIPLRVER